MGKPSRGGDFLQICIPTRPLKDPQSLLHNETGVARAALRYIKTTTDGSIHIYNSCIALKGEVCLYKMCFCSFIGKYAGMWTASNQWLEFVGGTISVTPMVDWGGGGVKCLKLWLNYFILEFGEYFYLVSWMYMQSLDTQMCFRTFYYDFCVGFHSICQKSTLWKTAKSQVKTEHLDCSLSKIKIWNTRELCFLKHPVFWISITRLWKQEPHFPLKMPNIIISF